MLIRHPFNIVLNASCCSISSIGTIDSFADMEHNMAFISLPIEIHYKYIPVIDLRDLGALMFTSKQLYELFGNDLKLQKIIYENTEQRVLHNKLRRPIKQLFMENRAIYALKIDDVEVFEYTMPSLSYKDVAYKLQPFSTNAQVVFSAKPTKNSKDSLQKIFDYDAAKCFNFLLEALITAIITKFPQKVKQDEEIFSSLVLIAIVCFKPMNIYGGSPSKLPYQKALRVLLVHFQKRKEMFLSSLVRGMVPKSPSISYAKMILATWIECGKEFPEFAVDLSMPISSEYLPIEFSNPLLDCKVETLLEYAAADQSGSAERFEYLLSLGANLDINAPYMPLAFIASPCSPLFQTLEKRGANINALLKPSNETILNHMLRKEWLKNHHIEFLLYKGAKLTPNEEALWLSLEPNAVQYKVAKSQQSEYNPLNTVGEIPEFTGQDYVFYSLKSSIWLYAGRRHEDYINRTQGVWEVKDGKLILEDTHAKIDFGSYSEDHPIEGVLPVRTFRLVKICTGIGFDVGLVKDDHTSDDEKMKNLLLGKLPE